MQANIRASLTHLRHGRLIFLRCTTPSLARRYARCGPQPGDEAHESAASSSPGGAAVTAHGARAAGRMRRIGVLLPTAADDAVYQTRMAAFLGDCSNWVGPTAAMFALKNGVMSGVLPSLTNGQNGVVTLTRMA